MNLTEVQDLKKYSTYREAGVDVDAGNDFVKAIKPFVKSTLRPEVRTEIGGFSGLFSLGSLNYKKPILATSTDGVGTKLKIAFMMDKHDTIGYDLVAMCVNDIIVNGAEPLFFLDYMATGKLKPETAISVIKGIAAACKEVNCALIGGETAEMPDFYTPGEYDLAGFVVGAVEDDDIIDGTSVAVGDKIIGIASSGIHSNGYSLVRKIIFEQNGLTVNDKIDGFRGTVGEELLTPTKLYSKTVLNLTKNFRISGFANITGGGLIDNVPRVLPDQCKARIFNGTWDVHPIFTYLQEQSGIDEYEMLRTFNMGIGFVTICSGDQTDAILERLAGLGEKAWLIGEVAQRKSGEPELEIE
jgi:phosphoribosylformylglycinamidine cyclo-ligase